MKVLERRSGGMRGWFERWAGGLVMMSAAVAAGLLLAIVPVSAQAPAPAYKGPRTKDGKADLNGIWEAMNTANWDLRAHAAAQGPVLSLGAAFSMLPGPGVIDGDGQIPYL